MKRGFKALAALTALVLAGPSAYAACSEELGGFAIHQCAFLAYFDAAPFSVSFDPNNRPTNVSGSFWQLSFGNKELNTGTASDGTGGYSTYDYYTYTFTFTFNGNDNGVAAVDLMNARAATGSTLPPASAICASNNNFGNSGYDGCVDNFRDPNLPSGSGNDGLLNPNFNVLTGPGTFSTRWVVDAPVALLLTESSNTWFAFASVGSLDRMNDPNDVRAGDYNFKDVNNGLANPTTPSANNVVPWQIVPGNDDGSNPFVRSLLFNDPNDKLNSTRHLVVGWNPAEIYQDNRHIDSNNPEVLAIYAGMGVPDHGPLARYVVESQDASALDPNDPDCGALDPNGYAPAPGVVVTGPDTAELDVAPATCVRLRTYLGVEPHTTSHTETNCRQGRCGDLGYSLTSRASLVAGGPLAGSPLLDMAARRIKGEVRLTWKTAAEAGISGFDVYAKSKKGEVKVNAAPIACKECDSGLGASYSFSLKSADLKGAKSLIIETIGTGARSRAIPIK